MAAKMKAGRGGPRKGAGRKPGSGAPAETVRRNRVVVMLRDEELAALETIARAEDRPLGTMLYRLVAPLLRRRGRG